MNKQTKLLTLFLLLGIFFSSGCANKVIYMNTKTARTIQKLGIKTKLTDQSLNVIDIGGIRKKVYQKTYTGGHFGFLGGALEALILEAEATIKMRKALGGSVDKVRNNLSDFSPGDVFNQNFMQELRVCETYMNIPKIVLLEGDIKDSAQDLDAVAEISYIYGIGAYTEDSVRTAISADIVIKRNTNQDILADFSHKVEKASKSPCTLEDYACNNGMLFKNDFAEATKSFAGIFAKYISYD